MTNLLSIEQEISRLVTISSFAAGGEARMGRPTVRALSCFRGGHDRLCRVRFCCLLHSVYAHMRPPDRSRQSVSPRKEIQQHDLQILHDQARIAVSVGLFQFANPKRRYHFRSIGLLDYERSIDDATGFNSRADL